MARRFFIAFSLLAFASLGAEQVRAQLLHSDRPLPTFEVATVRLHPPMPAPPPPPPDFAPGHAPAKIAPGRGGAQVTDRVHVILPMRVIIGFAYDVPAGFEDRSIIGGPAWVDSDVYEITAKIDDATFAALQKLPPDRQRDQIKLMEQALLAARFHLKIHFETRTMPAFALTLAKGRSTLTPARPGETTRLAMQGDTITATAVTLDQLLRSPFLSGRTILNHTGLTGAYDFTLTYSDRTDAAAEDSSSAPALSTAVQQQLGLKLVPTRAPIEVIVIDSIDRPSEN